MQECILEASEEMGRIIIHYMKGEVSKDQVEELRQKLHSKLELCKWGIHIGSVLFIALIFCIVCLFC